MLFISQNGALNVCRLHSHCACVLFDFAAGLTDFLSKLDERYNNKNGTGSRGDWDADPLADLQMQHQSGR